MDKRGGDRFLGYRGHSSLMPLAREIARGAAEALWPKRCVGCDELGTLLCERCARELPRIDQTWACKHCGAPFGWLLCTECLDGWEEDGQVVSALGFEGAAARLVTIYKDEHERRLAPLLARCIATALSEAQALASLSVDAIAFIPSTATAFARRGFDPMLGVAQELAKLLSLPVADELVHHEVQDQRTLNRAERQANVRGSFEAVREVWGARLLLIDDVITTGASLRAAREALVAGGAKVPWAASIARVW